MRASPAWLHLVLHSRLSSITSASRAAPARRLLTSAARSTAACMAVSTPGHTEDASPHASGPNCSQGPVSSSSMASARASMHTSPRPGAFVGGLSTPASEYHCTDFVWQDLREDPATIAALQRQQDQAATAAAAASKDADNGARVWEAFHARDNATARFYKERRYLLLAYPQLAQPDTHILELGCGCGSSLLPVLKANSTCRVTGSDISASAVAMLLRAAAQAGIAADRVAAHVGDGSSAAGSPVPDGSVDTVLIVFTLGALQPSAMQGMLRCAWAALKPGGTLCIRDHGLCDITQLRLHGERLLGPNLYRREDGTTCYFFSVEDLRVRMQRAGFEVLQCEYACTLLRNRKRGLDMRRVFCSGVGRKPETEM